jgi:hypothetical protein
VILEKNPPILLAFVVAILSYMLFSCGQIAPQLAQSVGYQVQQDTVTFTVDLHPALGLNESQTIPLKDFGSLQVHPGTNGQGMNLSLAVRQSTLDSTESFYLDHTANLPNSQSIPVESPQDFRMVKNRISNYFTGYMFFTMDAKQRYIGAALDISYFAESVPAGLVVQENLRNSAGEQVGLIVLYGPSEEKNSAAQRSPGGVFVLLNAHALVKSGTARDENGAISLVQNFTLYHGLYPTEHAVANQSAFSDYSRIDQLLLQVKADGKAAGMVD